MMSDKERMVNSGEENDYTMQTHIIGPQKLSFTDN